MSLGITTVQLGKNGYNEKSLENIRFFFKSRKDLKVNILKSYIRNQEELKELKEKMLKDLGIHYTAKVVGYSIFLKKWKREMRKEN